jgi:hypothetical protein
MRASPAPMVAIKSAKAASAQTMRRKALSNRLLVPSCCQCWHWPPFDFKYPGRSSYVRHCSCKGTSRWSAVASPWLDQRLVCSTTKVEATPPPLILPSPRGSQVGPFLRLLAETRFTSRASTSLRLPSVLATPVAEGDELSFPPAPYPPVGDATGEALAVEVNLNKAFAALVTNTHGQVQTS